MRDFLSMTGAHMWWPVELLCSMFITSWWSLMHAKTKYQRIFPFWYRVSALSGKILVFCVGKPDSALSVVKKDLGFSINRVSKIIWKGYWCGLLATVITYYYGIFGYKISTHFDQCPIQVRISHTSIFCEMNETRRGLIFAINLELLACKIGRP